MNDGEWIRRAAMRSRAAAWLHGIGSGPVAHRRVLAIVLRYWPSQQLARSGGGLEGRG
jgi:hypothetical protein